MKFLLFLTFLLNSSAVLASGCDNENEKRLGTFYMPIPSESCSPEVEQGLLDYYNIKRSAENLNPLQLSAKLNFDAKEYSFHLQDKSVLQKLEYSRYDKYGYSVIAQQINLIPMYHKCFDVPVQGVINKFSQVKPTKMIEKLAYTDSEWAKVNAFGVACRVYVINKDPFKVQFTLVNLFATE